MRAVRATRPCEARTTCRLCGSGDLELVIRLAPTPPANAFVAPADRGLPQRRFPLDVRFCTSCSHVQLGHVIDARTLFERYIYVSGTSPVFVDHFRRYAEDVLRRFEIPSDALVVDIGSNDGTLLRFFQAAGRRVLGIDPAIDIAKEASASGVETIPAFMSQDLAQAIRRERGPAAVVTANNVFAHIDDLASVTDAIAEMLAPDGLFVFEVSYLVDVYEKILFDTIYHEHLDYHTVKPLARFFASHGLELIDADRVDTHGGSLRGVAQLAGGRWPRRASVDDLIAEEARVGIDRAATLRAFGVRIEGLKRDLTKLLRTMRNSGERIAGFGAPAKATTLMHHFDLGPEVIEFIVDDSPRKQGLFTPGLHVPVLPVSALYDRRPQNVLVLAWNFADSIREKHQRFINEGGRMIVPLPRIELVGA